MAWAEAGDTGVAVGVTGLLLKLFFFENVRCTCLIKKKRVCKKYNPVAKGELPKAGRSTEKKNTQSAGFNGGAN